MLYNIKKYSRKGTKMLRKIAILYCLLFSFIGGVFALAPRTLLEEDFEQFSKKYRQEYIKEYELDSIIKEPVKSFESITKLRRNAIVMNKLGNADP